MLLAESLLGTNAASAPVYIEDVFSTYLYTGNSSTQTITNGIDLSTKGGLVWMKSRTFALDHQLYDTARGTGKLLYSNLTNAEATVGTGLTAFTTSGFTIGSSSGINDSSSTYASWTFRKQPKFFDVVTYTGNGANRTISHNLGATPGCIIVKRTDTTGGWVTYHRSTGNTGVLFLNTTAAFDADPSYWNNTSPTSTNFSVGTFTGVNANAGTYVAYLFAHDAGGFGATGTDNVISCGSYTGNGSATGPTITLGYEPQWVLIKQATNASTRWTITDNMRGFPVTSSGQQILQPNLNNAEIGVMYIQPTSTGFKVVDTDNDVNFNGSSYIYVAIRRGPMKTPTVGTSVFAANYGSDVTTYTTNFPLDSAWDTQLPAGSATSGTYIGARLLGGNSLVTTSTAAENTTVPPSSFWQSNTSYRWNTFGNECATYAFRRAPGFFDVVCYTGNGTSGRTVTHNLTVAPELIIARQRTGGDWYVYSSGTGATKYLVLNSTAAAATDSSLWNNTSPTSSVFTLGNATGVNRTATDFVAYLFATVAGVSKVGSYTGTGTTKQIDCGFTGGARFVLIKRTDSTGDWYVWDTARGIVAGNDPYYRLNTTGSEVTNTDYVDTYSAGFELSSTAPAALNANGGTFIFLAIA